MLSVAMGNYDSLLDSREEYFIDIKYYLVAYPDFLMATVAALFVILGKGPYTFLNSPPFRENYKSNIH